MPAHTTAIDLFVIGGYLTGMIAIGFWLARRNSNAAEFTSAGGTMPGWVVGLSIFGTYVSSISFLANPGKAYDANWNPFVFSISLPLAAWIATKYFVPFYRRNGHLSAYEHLEERFGPWARYYAGICFMLTQIARMATIMYLVALAVAPLTGWNITWTIIGTGLLVTVYTLLGGIEAVIWTDAIQSVVLTLGILATIGLILWQLPDGPIQAFEIARANDKFSLGSFKFDWTQSTFWVMLLYGLFINLNNFGIDQAYVQRYTTARSEADAQKSVWLGALLYVPISALLFFVGTALFAFYQVAPERLPEGLAIDEVYPHFIVSEFPTGLTGLLIASILAAAMSSVDSSLNSSATLIYEDWYKRIKGNNLSDRASMRVLHLATVAFGVIGTAAAIAMIGNQSALDVWWKMAGIFSGGMLGLFLLGLLSRQASKSAALPATVLCVLLILYLSLSQTSLWPEAFESYRNPLHTNLTIVLGTSLLVLVGFAIVLLSSNRREKSTGH